MKFLEIHNNVITSGKTKSDDIGQIITLTGDIYLVTLSLLKELHVITLYG